MSKKTKYYLIARYLIFILIFLSCGTGDKSEAPDKKIPVKIAAVELQEISIPIHTSGLLASPAEIKMSFKIGGIIEKIAVDEGQTVKKDQILAALKQSEIKARVNQARSAYAKAKRDFERIQLLYQDSVATLEQKQDAETGLTVAQSNLEIAAFNSRYSRILAPSDGKILKLLAEENELVEQGKPIFIFGTSTKSWILRVGVTDREIVKLSLGDSAQIFFDTYPEIPFSATVSEIAESASPFTGTYEVELTLAKKQQRLISGFVGKADIFPSKKEKYYLIPIEALVEADGRNGFIYTYQSADQTVNRVPVKIADIFTDKVAISSGLKNNQEIVTEGAAYLTEGTKVQVTDQ
jgi:multidrug efflux system membrane fusion protein